jgi:DNA-binding PadR family transcriptional regulator
MTTEIDNNYKTIHPALIKLEKRGPISTTHKGKQIKKIKQLFFLRRIFMLYYT